MALEKFGIKEVADVKFYNVGTVTVDPITGAVNAVEAEVLSFDTLKVSTIEFTAEQSEARGGKGNAPLIIWDYGREINVTLEDALLSLTSMEAMFGDIHGDNKIEINANSFPGTYAVVGKTFARDFHTGKDHLFTFYIPKAKVQSENTITMEADGDPTVFNMSLRVLRGENGKMMELIADTNEYDVESGIWGGVAGSQMYTIKFVDTNGVTTTYTLPAGATVTAPSIAEGEYPSASTIVTGNATYFAVKTKA